MNDATLAPSDDTGSLSDHEAQWGGRRGAERPVAVPVTTPEPEPLEDDALLAPTSVADAQTDAKAESLAAEEAARDPQGRFKQKHRAAKDVASPADVPRIRSLSARVKELEAQLASAKTPTPVATPTPVVAAPLAPAAAPVTPTKPFAFPAFDAWLTAHPDQSYEDWELDRATAVADWRYDQRDAARQADAATQQQTQAKQIRDEAYRTRATDFAKGHPDYWTKINAAQAAGHDLPPLVTAAIFTSDRGPDVLYHLLGQPDEMDRLFLSHATTPVTEATVVAMQRHLLTRLSTGTTGAVTTPTPIVRSPRPPTPVRTGPLHAGTDPPDDGASLAAFEQYWHKPKRR